MNRKQITYFNIFSLACVLALLVIHQTSIAAYLLPLQILIALYIILILPGVNITYVIESVAKRSYDLAVFVNISLLTSLLVPPFLLVSLYQSLNSVDLFLALAAYMTFMTLPYLWHLVSFMARRWVLFDESPALFFPKISLWAFISHPMFVVLVVVTLTHSYNLTRFSFLPAPDSYSWLMDFEDKLPVHNMPLIADPSRRSFPAFIAAFFFMGRIDLYHLFKYFLPFLSLLVIVPMWLAARQLPNYMFRLVFLLAAVLISPTIILEFDFIRQQILFLIFLYFSVGLQTYSIYNKDSSIFYILGLLSLFGTTVHPAFLILALAWLLAFVLSRIKILWRHKYKFIVIAALLFPWAEKADIVNMYVRMREQAHASWGNFIAGNWNMRFPAYYVSSDGYEMSWPGFTGVLKYYAYYAGPISLLVLLVFVIFVLSNKYFRTNFISFFSKPAFLNMLIPFTLFFVISDIAPRFGNIAFLPERAWQYLSILITFPFFLILLHISEFRVNMKKVGLLVPLFIVLVMTFAGAAYVNNLTKYTMPDYEHVASVWILNNTDAGSRIYASSSKNIIRYHAQRTFGGLKDNFYKESDPVEMLKHLSSELSLQTDVSSNLTRVSALLSDISFRAAGAKANLVMEIKYRDISFDTYDALDAALRGVSQSVKIALDHVVTAREFHKFNIFDIENVSPTYIYYAQTHPKNPYSSRPYESSFTASLDITEFGALDNRPDIFERVYTDRDKVAIWRVKTNNLNTYDLPIITP